MSAYLQKSKRGRTILSNTKWNKEVRPYWESLPHAAPWTRHKVTAQKFGINPTTVASRSKDISDPWVLKVVMPEGYASELAKINEKAALAADRLQWNHIKGHSVPDAAGIADAAASTEVRSRINESHRAELMMLKPDAQDVQTMFRGAVRDFIESEAEKDETERGKKQAQASIKIKFSKEAAMALKSIVESTALLIQSERQVYGMNTVVDTAPPVLPNETQSRYNAEIEEAERQHKARLAELDRIANSKFVELPDGEGAAPQDDAEEAE